MEWTGLFRILDICPRGDAAAQTRLDDVQWRRIEAALGAGPQQASDDLRSVVEAALWVARTGRPWSCLPPSLGPWPAIQARHAEWCGKGAWRHLARALGG